MDLCRRFDRYLGKYDNFLSDERVDGALYFMCNHNASLTKHVGVVATTSLSVREVWGLILGPVKSHTVSLATAVTFFQSSKLWCRGDGALPFVTCFPKYRSCNEDLIRIFLLCLSIKKHFETWHCILFNTDFGLKFLDFGLKSKSNLHYTRSITPKRVTSGGAHPRGLAPGQHSSEKTW